VGDQFALKNNQIFVLAEAAGGVYNSDQLRVLCEVADNESAFLKITEDQRIGFMVDPNKLGDIQAQVRKSGLLLRSYKSSGVPSPRACLGELCTFAHQPSLGDALELATHLLKSFPAPKRFSTIGVNGCQRACLGSSTEDIHVVAEESGYKISIGGKGSDIPQQAQLILDNIPRADLPVVVEKILAVFYQESQEGERIIDVIDRIGLTPFFDSLPEHLVPNIHLPSPGSSDDAGAIDSHTEQADALADLNPANEHNAATQPEAGSLTANDALADSLDALLDVEEDTEMTKASTLDGDVLAAGGITDDTLADDLLAGEPIVDIKTPEMDADGLGDADSLAGDLLEVAESDLEEGSLEDVERVRDAIRTELSMSTLSEQTIRPRTSDLLEELGSVDVIGADPFDTNEDNELQNSAIEEIDDGIIPNDAFDSIESDTAASIEHRGPRKNPSAKTQKPTAPTKKTWSSGNNSAPIGGRLGIRFVGDQLSVELPSGLSFELPLDSVSEGTELSMSLPDGDLRIQRDGQILAVSLGMLNLKIPVPQLDSFQVA
jgi:rRNA maturation endonuclease Nob1